MARRVLSSRGQTLPATPAEPGPAAAPVSAGPVRQLLRPTFPTWREWQLFLLQLILVIAIEVCDDLLRGLVFPRAVGPVQANAVRLMEFESRHHLWIEPGVQRFFEQPHHILGWTMTWPQVVTLVNSFYGLSHGLVTVSVAVWLYWRRPDLFPFVRNVFVFATALSVATYNIYPVAPPRLAAGLLYNGRPYHFADTVFEHGGVNLSFDQYAAMPSLHVGWALIAGLTLLIFAKPLIFRLIGLLHPALMCLTVIVTGNHYLLDCLVAVGLDGVAFALALLLQHWPAVAAIGGRRSAAGYRGHVLPGLGPNSKSHTSS